jgi:hypothetical protein
MYIGHIAGLAFLPVSILIYLDSFGITKINKLLGVSLLLIASIGLIIIQIGDIIHSHFSDEHIILTWAVGGLLMIPAFVYFLSFLVTMPAGITASLPLIMASFLFVEGTSSVFIGN